MSFDSAFEKTVGLEGGFGKDPNDKGNWTGGAIGSGELKGTKYGISAAAFPYEDIENLTLDRAKELYQLHYWNPLKLDEVPHDAIQEEIFDTGVNMGIGGSSLIVQRSINFLEIGKPLVEDGAIGPVTLGYVKKWCGKDPECLFKVLNGFQFIRYVEIDNERYSYGWMKRIQQYKQGQQVVSVPQKTWFERIFGR